MEIRQKRMEAAKDYADHHRLEETKWVRHLGVLIIWVDGDNPDPELRRRKVRVEDVEKIMFAFNGEHVWPNMHGELEE